MRSKHQDDLDKKSTNHLPLPLDYASNEGKIFFINNMLVVYSNYENHIIKIIQKNLTFLKKMDVTRSIYADKRFGIVF